MRKLSEVMAVVDRIPKTGRNEFHKYDYVTEADITSAVRIELAKRCIIIVPSAVDSKETPVGDKGQRVFTQKMRFTAMDGESGETISWEMYGQGSDSLDKGAFKSTTGAVKYALLKLFLIPTGDDPEKDEKPSRTLPKPSGTEGLAGKAASAPIPPVANSPEARSEPALHDRSLVLLFNNADKKPLHSLDVKSLRWFEKALRENVDDPKKTNYREANMKALQSVVGELKFRGL